MKVIPSGSELAKGVVLVAVCTVIINAIKPYLPAAVSKYL